MNEGARLSFWDNRELTLWHGTTLDRARRIQATAPDLSRSRKSLDFGRGFYATTRQRQATDWALRAASKTRTHPALISWRVRYDDFDHWPKIVFADAGKSSHDFWRFVELNRTLEQPHRSKPLGYFDIVAGPASKNYVARNGVEDMDQISFHTDAAITLLMGLTSTVHALNLPAKK